MHEIATVLQKGPQAVFLVLYTKASLDSILGPSKIGQWMKCIDISDSSNQSNW